MTPVDLASAPLASSLSNSTSFLRNHATVAPSGKPFFTNLLICTEVFFFFFYAPAPYRDTNATWHLNFNIFVNGLVLAILRTFCLLSATWTTLFLRILSEREHYTDDLSSPLSCIVATKAQLPETTGQAFPSLLTSHSSAGNLP